MVKVAAFCRCIGCIQCKVMFQARSTQVLSIVQWTISTCIITPIEVRWFLIFWIRRRNPFISTRKPTLLLIQLLSYWCCYFLLVSNWVLDSFYRDLPGPIWHGYIPFVVNFTTILLWNSFVGLSISRSWLLFFS